MLKKKPKESSRGLSPGEEATLRLFFEKLAELVLDKPKEMKNISDKLLSDDKTKNHLAETLHSSVMRYLAVDIESHLSMKIENSRALNNVVKKLTDHHMALISISLNKFGRILESELKKSLK